jgi:hypothetical protein
VRRKIHSAAPLPADRRRGAAAAGEDAKVVKGQGGARREGGQGAAQGGSGGGGGGGAAPGGAGDDARGVQLLLWQLLHKVLLNYVPPPLEGPALEAALAGAARGSRRRGAPGAAPRQGRAPVLADLPCEPMRRPEHEASYAMLHARVVPDSRVIEFLARQMFGQGHFWCGSAGLHDLSTSSVVLFGSIGGSSGFHLDPSAAENTAWPVDLRFEGDDASLAARATRGAHAAYAREVRTRRVQLPRCPAAPLPRCPAAPLPRCPVALPCPPHRRRVPHRPPLRPGTWPLGPTRHPCPRPATRHPRACRPARSTSPSPSPGRATSGWWTWTRCSLALWPSGPSYTPAPPSTPSTG